METECEGHSAEKICKGKKKKAGSSQRGRRRGKAAVGRVVPKARQVMKTRIVFLL